MFGKKKSGFAMELPPQSGETEITETAAMAPAIVEKAAPVKGKGKGKGEKAAETVAPVAPISVPSTESIIQSAVLAASQEAAVKAAANVGIFSENYLTNAGNTASRRRPGMNMTAFKTMAKNVKR